MNTDTIVELGKKYLKGKVAIKAGKYLLTRRAGFIGLGIGAAAGAGYLAYNYFSNKKNGTITHIDDIDANHPETNGEKKIVI
ncbi:hypothetical protein LZ575_18720 [Antarcticibacterium sp. 1MA-6-2]|uniref:hypothetical protein n=1 Tax=Antarcticibacterium sp. 1MA-6-2 TaxID=2908210 RepID=UPI001F21D0CF|nr:hypothetical protein [Antarcticibacterium sp. 1MA-6-2]UJH90767.1 hypothetical protein LZ575_18720 [Antarcticibacterium sp. 1MA-6-2]